MRHKRLVFLFLLLPLFCCPTLETKAEFYQDDPTPSPSPTWEPLIKTNTPGPAVNYLCPEGTPGGYMTITPDIMWLANCGYCMLTLTPYPTKTATATATMTPTWNMTGTPPTSIPTQTNVPGQNEFYFLDIEDQEWYATNVGNDGYWNWFYAMWTNPFYDTGYNVVGIVYRADSMWGNWSQMASGYSTYTANFWSNGANQYTVDSYYVSIPAWASAEWSKSGVSPYDYYADFAAFQAWMEPQLTVTGNPIRWVNTGALIQNNTMTVKMLWKVLPVYGNNHIKIVGLIATGPLETPIEPNYCVNMRGSVGGAGITYDLPNIYVGPASCHGIGEEEIPSLFEEGVMQVMEWFGMPTPFVVCFKPVNMGTLNVLGMTLDMDAVLFAIGATALLRWLLRS